MPNTLNVHIVPITARRGWRVTHAALTLSVHHTQRRAVVAGIRLARRNRLDVVTHARNGRIRSKDSYGNERPARDREH